MVGKEEFCPFPLYHPFGRSVCKVAYDQRIFKLPKLEYDGTTDPRQHLAKFSAHMLLYGIPDPLMCRIFPCTLTGRAILWFFTLPSHSINNFSQLCEKFLSRFVLSKPYPKLPVTLKFLKQGVNESLQDYLNRFNQEALKVDHFPEELCIRLIEASLKPGSFKESLIEKPLLNLDDLWTRAACFVDALHDNKLRKD